MSEGTLIELLLVAALGALARRPPKSQQGSGELGRIFLGIAAFTFPLNAQQTDVPNLTKLSLEELMNIEVATVNAASKFDQKVTTAPSYVSIITAEEIQKYGYRTLADLLASVTGFYINNDRNYSYVGVRGLGRPSDYNDRVLLMIDGHRLNDSVYGEALIGTEFPLDIDLIQRVEIIRGAGSALYGTNAFLAIINVITKRGRDVRGAEVSAEAGSLGTYKGSGTFGDRWLKGPELLLSGTYYNSHGNNNLFFPEFNTPATNNGIAANADGDESYKFFSRFEYRDFSLQGLYGSRTKVIPTASFGAVFNDPRTRTTDAIGYFDLRYEHHFANEWQILGRLAYDHMSYRGVYVNDYAATGTPPFTLNQDLSTGDRVTLAFDASRIFFEKHRVTIGTETQFNLKQDQSNYDLAPYSQYLDDHRNSTVPAVYLQDEFSVRKDVIVSAGVRWDHYGTFGSTVNPRLGLIYSPGKRTTFKVLYGSAFRAPNTYELYYAAPPDQAASLFLQPETIRTTEIVFGQRLTKHLQLVISGFYNDLRGLISQQADPVTGLISYANLENVHGKGVDFELAGKWLNGAEGRVSYTRQQSRDQQSGTMLTDSPKNLAKVNISVPIAPKWLFASIEGQYRGEVGTLAGEQIGGFVIANATLSSPETRGVIISGGAYNMFNKRHADPGGAELMEDSILQNGRTLRVKVTYRFGKR